MKPPAFSGDRPLLARVPSASAGKRDVPAPKGRPSLGSYRVEQRKLSHKGREFHFVSYDALPGMLGASSMWFLMSSGTRWEAVAQIPGEDPAETDARLIEWLDRTIDV